ncbi:MAG: peptidase and in kexin sedolisin [Frankiales bacterium]|nr:peptidase and in kexin sedolisin [Frankiales bacterium]
MDDARSARRPAALLALAVAAVTGLSALSPAAASAPLAGATTVVVTSATGGVEAAAAAVRTAGGTVLSRLSLIDGVGATLPTDAVLAPGYSVVANIPMSLTASKKNPGLEREATAVREALGLGPAADQGAGTTVAVVDTGVTDVPDLAGRLQHVDVTGTWLPGQPRDAYGHGTFVAGVVAGDGSSSDDRRYAGVAPGADVLDVRVADADGSTDLVTVLAGLEEAARPEHGVDVVNLSMSSGSPLPHQIDPLTVALDRLWAQGIVVVVPSGNDGPGTGTVTSPGSDPVLLTVGALDERLTATRSDDVVPGFSGRGPTRQGDAKPDLVAPGRSLVSLRAPGSSADLENPASVVDGSYFRGSGTSFSTALVSGSAALLREQHGDLRPDQVKALVTATAYGAKGLKDARDAGAGGLDLPRALATPPTQAPDAVVDSRPPGDEAVWEEFLQAVEDGDRRAAADSWARLSLASHRWAANSWSSHRWAANSWSSHRWADAGTSADEWALRLWASHRWASHRWAASSRWAGEDEWAASRWAASRWAASRWAGSWE